LNPDEQKRVIHVRQFHERGIVAVNYWDEPCSLLIPWNILGGKSSGVPGDSREENCPVPRAIGNIKSALRR